MPRIARFTVENGTYHVLSRGHNQKNIFHGDKDYKKYLELFLEYKKVCSLKIYHYCLMTNHVHFIFQAPDGYSLSKAMRGVNQRYAQYYRKKYRGSGYVWQDRFKSYLIQKGRYLLICGRYVELNPVQAGICKKPEDYPWSSYKTYALGASDPLLNLNPEYLRLSDNPVRRAEIYRNFVRDGLTERRKLDRYFKQGAFGDENFIKKLKLHGLRSVWSHKGQPRKTKGAF